MNRDALCSGKRFKRSLQAFRGKPKKVKSYFLSKRLSEEDLVFSSISTQTIYEMLPNGIYSTKVDSYRLSQSIQITSKDVDKITDLSRKSTELINSGVQFESMPPQYYLYKACRFKDRDAFFSNIRCCKKSKTTDCQEHRK